jgi:hypothetical protein
MWSAFHAYFHSNNASSSSLISAILEANFAPVTTVVTSSISGSTSYPAGDASGVNNKKEEAVTSPQDETRRSSFPLSKPLNASSRHLLYKRFEHHFNTRTPDLSLEPYQNDGTCTHRNIVQENSNQSTIENVACCGLGHRLGRMSAAAVVAFKLKAHLYGYWGCCDDVEVFSHLFGPEPIVLYDDSDDDSDNDDNQATPMAMIDIVPSAANTTTTTHSPIHLQFRNEVVGFVGEGLIKCEATDEKIKSDFAFYSTLRQRYTHKHVVDKFVHEHFTNETLSIAIHIRAGNGETGDFAEKKRHIEDPGAFVHNTADMIREIVSRNAKFTSSRPLSPLVFIATDTRSYVDVFRKELATGAIPIPVVTLPAQVHAAEGEGVMFGVFNKVTQSGEKCLDGWRNVVEDMLVLSHADIVFAPSYSSFTQTIPISLALGRSKNAHGESKGHITAPFCDVIEGGKVTCYETLKQWHCSPHPYRGISVTHQDMSESWRDVLLPVS